MKQKEREIWIVVPYELLASRFTRDSFGFKRFKHFWAHVPKIRFGAPKAPGSLFLIMHI